MKKILLCCLVFLSVSVFAADSLEYFQAVVPVTSQSAENRKFAAQKGMQEVVIRLSASEEVLKNETVKAAIDRAQSYLEQFQFRTVQDEELKRKGYKEEMYLVFSPALIQKLLRDKARVRYWAVGNRPTILVWLVEDHPQFGKQLLNASSVDEEGNIHPLIAEVQKAAKARGLPLEFPVLDLEDQMAISSREVWQLNEEKIREASQRYAAPVILIGRYSTTSRDELWSTWQYFHLGYQQTWDVREKELDAFADSALAPLNTFLAQRYAILPGSLTSDADLVMRLEGINTFKQYRQSLDYLNGLAMVSHVEIIEAKEGELLLAVDSEADLERFKTSVQLDRKIEFQRQQHDIPEWQMLPEGTRENPVHFLWSGS